MSFATDSVSNTKTYLLGITTKQILLLDTGTGYRIQSYETYREEVLQPFIGGLYEHLYFKECNSNTYIQSQEIA